MQFTLPSIIFNKKKHIPLEHFVLSFDGYYDKNITPAIAYEIGADICNYFYEKNQQVIYSVHEDTDHVHLHILVNTVSILDGKLQHTWKAEYYELQRWVQIALSVIPHSYGIQSYRLVFNEL